MLPHELLPDLPACGGWVAFALAAACWEQADEEAANRIRGIKGGVFPVVVVGG